MDSIKQVSIEVRAMKKIALVLNIICTRIFKNCKDARHIRLSSVIGHKCKSTTFAWVTWTDGGENWKQLHIGPYEVWRRTMGLWGFGCRKEPCWPKFTESHEF